MRQVTFEPITLDGNAANEFYKPYEVISGYEPIFGVVLNSGSWAWNVSGVNLYNSSVHIVVNSFGYSVQTTGQPTVMIIYRKII